MIIFQWWRYNPSKERDQWNQVKTGARHAGGGGLGLAASETFTSYTRSGIWLIGFLLLALFAHLFVEAPSLFGLASDSDPFTFTRVLVHVIMAFLVCPFILGIRLRERFVELFTAFLVALFLPVGLMYLSKLFMWAGVDIHNPIMWVTNIVFVPIWIYYALFQEHVDFEIRGWSVKGFIGGLVLFAWILVIVLFMINQIGDIDTKFAFAEISPEYKAQGMEQLKKAPEVVASAAKSFGAKVRDAVTGLFRSQIIAVVGEDYYVGRVEEGKAEPLGVYIVDMKASASQFYDDEPVSVWAVLKARTLDPEKTIKVNTECLSVPDQVVPGLENRIMGDANPEDPLMLNLIYDIANLEHIDLSCEFPAGRLEAGSRKVFFNTTFDFSTDSFYKVYFMDKERVRSLERQGINPIMHYGISEPTTIAVFTNGPIGIGMETTITDHGTLVPITKNGFFKFGFTVENKWGGGIQKIKNITFKLPEGTSIEKASCDFNLEEMPCTSEMPECEEGKYTKIYRVAQASLREAGREAGGTALKRGLDVVNRIFSAKEKKYLSFNCRAKAENADALLGNTPIAINYFKVSAEYTYQLEKSINVNVKRYAETAVPKTPAYTGTPGETGTAVEEGEYAPSTGVPGGFTPWKSDEATARNIWKKYKEFITESHIRSGEKTGHRVEKELIVGTMCAESAGNPLAISPVGAAGLTQFMPATARGYGFNVHECCVLEEGETGGRCALEIKRCKKRSWCAEGGYTCSPDPNDPLYDERFNERQSIIMKGLLTSDNILKYSKLVGKESSLGKYLAMYAYNAGNWAAYVYNMAKKEGIASPTWEDIKEQSARRIKNGAGINSYVEHVFACSEVAKRIIEEDEGKQAPAVT